MHDQVDPEVAGPPVENSPENFLAAGRIALEKLAGYLADSRAGKTPVLQMEAMPGLAAALELEKWIRQGGMTAIQTGDFLDRYLPWTMHMHHPAYIGHQVAVPHFAGAIAELVHGLTNNPMAIYEMGPAAATAELVVVNWMLEKAGWFRGGHLADFSPHPDQGAGVFTHGGSLANLTALLGARAAADPDAWENGNNGDLAVLAPPSAHYSVGRAASIMGLGSRCLHPLRVDGLERVVPDALPAAVRELRDKGKRVMAVVGSACATSTGLYDPLDEIASFCEEEDLWLHVDSPHGASALLSARERPLLRGLERARSFTWDAHKMLRTPTLSTAVLFRHREDLERVFHQKASYLFYERENTGIDLIGFTVECTKAELGLKLFFVLAALGENGLARFVEEQYDKAKSFYRLISARPGFECPYFPQTNVLCFRYTGGDERQIAIRDALIREGHYYISSCEVLGRRYLRLSVMSPDTDEHTIAGLLDAIERLAPAA